MELPIIYLLLFITYALGALNPNWRLAWSDEFNTLDTTKWNIRNKAGNYGNQELQWYSPTQVNVSDGNLVITAIKESFGGESYVSGWVDTQDKAVFTYGRYEIRAKMAGGTKNRRNIGQGLWPAMWILSQNKCWASGAEVDIAEFRGSYPKNIGMYYHYSSKCCTSFSNCISSTGSEHTTKSDLTADYHVYALEWYPENMTWYLDGAYVDSFETTDLNVAEDVSPHYWIINHAIGGSYPGNPNKYTVFPNTHLVDYVRNYVWRPSCSGVTCSNHGCCNATSVLCVCDAGWAGANCEQDLTSATNTFDAVTSLDNIPNGWGNDFTTYITQNAVPTSGSMKLTLSSSGCPNSCGGKSYASGAWESIPRYTYGTFTFNAQASNVQGTGLSLQAAGESTVLEQIAFTIWGGNSTWVQLWTWHLGYGYQQADIKLNFDASAGYHNYSFTWGPSLLTFYVDNQQIYSTPYVQLSATRLGPGAYYTYEPDYYGGPSHTSIGTSAAYINNFSWQITPAKATCS